MVLLAAGVGAAFLIEGVEGVEVEDLATGELANVPARLLEKRLGALGVVHVGHRHAPVRQGARGVELRCLAEGAFRLEVEERMELGDPLVDERLGLGVTRRDGEGYFSHAGHERRGMARAIVERLAVDRVARGGNGGVRLARRGGRLGRLIGSQGNRQKSDSRTNPADGPFRSHRRVSTVQPGRRGAITKSRANRAPG